MSQRFGKKLRAMAFILLSSLLAAVELPVAIIGGQDASGNAYAAFVNPFTKAAGPSFTGLPLNAAVGGAINTPRQAAVGGADFSSLLAYGAFVNQNTNAVKPPISNIALAAQGSLASRWINDFNRVIIGGQQGSQDFYVAFVDMQTNTAGPAVTGVPMPDSNSFCNGSVINNAGQALIAGGNMNTPYAARVDAAANAISAVIANTPATSGDILYSCALNESGLGLIGGRDTDSNTAYAAFIAPNTNTALPNIFNPGMGIRTIYGVALNDFGQALIGGWTDTSTVYAAFIDPVTHVVSPISGLPSNPGSFINIGGVAINNFGQGLIGGFDGMQAYAAFIDPITKSAVTISNLPMGGQILAVGLVKTPYLPTQNLSGNNLIFTNYINNNAPQLAFYFVPAWVSGNLVDALEQAAPTRNAISLFTADNNLLYLSHGLSVHLRNHRHFREHRKQELEMIATRYLEKDSLIASANKDVSLLQNLPRYVQQSPTKQVVQKSPTSSCVSEEPSSDASICPKTPILDRASYCLWFEALGVLASQKKQEQTTGFDPSVAGAILAFDAKTKANSLVGGGIAYTYTHISEKEDTGYSRINQEYLFAYATWMHRHFYFDGALWGGLFQIHQVREIDLNGFQFRSVSGPDGWQISPHVEFGYDHTWTFYEDRSLDLVLDPFLMLDWVNAWQEAYQERGAGPFNVGQKAHYSSLLRTEIGLRLYQTLFFKKWLCTFEEKGSYVNKAPFGVGTMNAFLVGSPGTFTVETLSQIQNLGVAEVALILEPVDHSDPYGSLSYQGEFSPSFQSHQISAEVSWDF